MLKFTKKQFLIIAFILLFIGHEVTVIVFKLKSNEGIKDSLIAFLIVIIPLAIMLVKDFKEKQ